MAKEGKFSSLEAKFSRKIDELERTALGFHEFRHRFISTYKRDILNDADSKDMQFIRAGNEVVNRGNCIRDTELYQGTNPRSEILTF